jgi:hypothetical protein
MIALRVVGYNSTDETIEASFTQSARDFQFCGTAVPDQI